MPGIGISIFIGAVGAMLRYAVTTATPGFNIHTGGVILMFVGGIGVLFSLLFWTSFSPFGAQTRSTRRQTTTVEDGTDGAVVRTRETTDRASL